jgi:hypothetical protein
MVYNRSIFHQGQDEWFDYRYEAIARQSVTTIMMGILLVALWELMEKHYGGHTSIETATREIFGSLHSDIYHRLSLILSDIETVALQSLTPGWKLLGEKTSTKTINNLIYESIFVCWDIKSTSIDAKFHGFIVFKIGVAHLLYVLKRFIRQSKYRKMCIFSLRYICYVCTWSKWYILRFVCLGRPAWFLYC